MHNSKISFSPTALTNIPVLIPCIHQSYHEANWHCAYMTKILMARDQQSVWIQFISIWDKMASSILENLLLLLIEHFYGIKVSGLYNLGVNTCKFSLKIQNVVPFVKLNATREMTEFFFQFYYNISTTTQWTPLINRRLWCQPSHPMALIMFYFNIVCGESFHK